MAQRRKKSLLIGINYTQSAHALSGCHVDVSNVAEFLSYRGYPADRRSQIILRDDHRTDPRGPLYPTGHNILAAVDWLVAEPGCACFLHYSGHGGQVRSDSPSGFSDTIVPVDFETNGQIDSSILHQHVVSALPPSSTLFVLLDCCHSGSALELPFVYRSDADGNINLMDNLKEGVALAGQAGLLLEGGFSFDKLGEAAQLYAGATDFFRGLRHEVDHLQHGGQERPPGLEEDEVYGRRGAGEGRWVTMFSGCKDEQTSADATIQGRHQGAMSWAFLETMRRDGDPAYESTLAMTRQLLDQSHYTQIPQLSVGVQMDLDAPLMM